MLVGTYTDAGSHGIYTYRFDPETGASHLLDSLALNNPSFLQPDATGRFVYAVSEMSDGTASLCAMQLDQHTGKLTLLDEHGCQPTQGADPCHVATNGQLVTTANYSGGSLSVFRIGQDGGVASLDTLFHGEATGNDTIRQATPHMHCSIFTPDGRYLFATDFSADRILRFTVGTETTTLHSPSTAATLASGAGPRHFTFSPDGRFLYLLDELDGHVVAFSYHDGILTQQQRIVADTCAARGSADIHLSPDGRFLYASNRLKHDGLAIYSVNPSDGMLTYVGYQTTGKHPRNFALTPDGKFLLVACRDSHTIEVYTRHETTGLLTATNQQIHLSKPVCVQFVSPNQEVN